MTGDAVATKLRQLVERLFPALQLIDGYRGRIRSQSADRVAVQRINPDDGSTENITPVRILPGVSGVSMDLQPGAEVLVLHVGQQRSPYVIAFPAENQQGHVPVEVRMEVQSVLKLVPGESAAGAAGTVQMGPDAEVPVALIVAPGLNVVMNNLSAVLSAFIPWASLIDTTVGPTGLFPALLSAINTLGISIAVAQQPYTTGGYETTRSKSS